MTVYFLFSSAAMALALSDLPEDHPGREEMLRAFQSHIAALVKHQDPTGMWHQVVDHTGSYRELSCTSMITFSLIRGVGNGWLKEDVYGPVIDKAYNAILTRIASDGTLIDVCTGTGKQKSLRAYFDRKALLGRDPRGGGRSSARETTMRVAAGVVAKKWLAERFGVTVRGYLSQLGDMFFGPVAHLLFHHARLDAVAVRLDDLLRDFLDQIAMPTAMAALFAGTFGQSAAGNLQSIGERNPVRIDLPFGGSPINQNANEIVTQQQPVDFLHDSRRRLLRKTGRSRWCVLNSTAARISPEITS